MTKGVQWIKERVSTTLRLTRSNPVLLEGNRMDKIIIHHILSLHTSPTKYRRPSEGRRDSFGGGVGRRGSRRILGRNGPGYAKSFETSRFDSGSKVTTSKAISRRYPLTGDCYRKDVSSESFSVFGAKARKA